MEDNPLTFGPLIRTPRARNRWALKDMSQKTRIPLSSLAKGAHDRLMHGCDEVADQVGQSDCGARAAAGAAL